jgi:hypothetical protein
MARRGAIEICVVVAIAGCGSAFALDRPFLALSVTAAAVAGLLAAPDVVERSGLVYLLTSLFVGALWVLARGGKRRESLAERLARVKPRLMVGAMLVAAAGGVVLDIGTWSASGSSHHHRAALLIAAGALMIAVGISVAYPLTVIVDVLQFQADAATYRHELAALRKELRQRLDPVALATVVAFVLAAVFALIDAGHDAGKAG